jgi:predicted nucleic-acid-binding protein
MQPSASTSRRSIVYAVDTNVVVRVLVGDDNEQQTKALARRRDIREIDGSVVVGVVVLAEVAWVLARAYGYERSHIVAAVQALLNTPPFVVPQRAVVLRALEIYENGSADFADYLILALAQAEGCTTLITFDRRLLRLPDCQMP